MDRGSEGGIVLYPCGLVPITRYVAAVRQCLMALSDEKAGVLPIGRRIR